MAPRTTTRKKKGRISKTAACIRKTTNTARVPRKFLIDSHDYKPDVYVGTASSKYATLVTKIRELDADDMRTHGTKFKHFIFTDIREAAYGAKAIAGFLAASGFDFRMKHAQRTIRRGGKEVTTKHGTTQLDEKPAVYGGSNSFALLQSLPLWKTPLPVETKKQILAVYNRRPENVHGELLRILVLDSKFKEGIDLFDVKYVHLMEPAIASSDLKQAIGRATRFCGQRGLHFIPQRGWPLQVYVYKTLLPQRAPFLRPDTAPLVGAALQKATNEMFAGAAAPPRVIESVDAHELMLAYSGLDLALLNTTKELTILAILTAVDYDLNYKINNFTAEPIVLDELGELGEYDAVLETPPSGRQSGGAVHFLDDLTPEMLQTCSHRKSALFPFTKARMEHLARRIGIRPPRGAKREWYCKALMEYPQLYAALKGERGSSPPLVRRPTPHPSPTQGALLQSNSENANANANIALERLRELFPPPPGAAASPRRRQAGTETLNVAADFAEFQTQVRRLYGRFAWASPVVENGCTTSAIVPAGAPVTFTRTQDFIRHYLTPASPFKGLLAWHSVGTGKTCMAVAAATSEFERAGYTILWVTRNALMADVYKNIFGAVCSIPVAEAVRAGATVPTGRAAQARMLGRQWIQPISYKMFQNALEKKNALGRQLWNNSPSDPLARTFLVIDEVHKLRDGDLSAAEFAEFNVIQKFIHKSYASSGPDSVRPLLMTATPISDTPGELFDILNTLIPEPGRRLMEFDAFRRAYTDAHGVIQEAGRDYFRDRAKGLISYLNREYDPTTFAQPEFHTIAVPAGEARPPTAGALADQCLAGGAPLALPPPPGAADAAFEAELARAEALGTAGERKKAAAAARRTYKQAAAAAQRTRKAAVTAAVRAARGCYSSVKEGYTKTAGRVQTQAIEACFAAGGAGREGRTKFPSVRDFTAALTARLEAPEDAAQLSPPSSIRSTGAVVNRD
jgi:hypothetical protein